MGNQYTNPDKITKFKCYKYYNNNLDSESCIRLFATPWTIQSMQFSRPEYWSGEPFPSPGPNRNRLTDMENKLKFTKGVRGWRRDKSGVWD